MSQLSVNEMSWHSVFWGLVPIALNTMTQPAGMVAGFPSNYGFVLRSSPIICVIDTLDIVRKFIIYSREWHSLRLGAQYIAHDRFQDIEDEREEGSFTSLRKNTVFRWLLFVLGALPQVLKLGAARGLLWTNVWSAFYLSSFLVVEVIVLFGGRDWEAVGQFDRVDVNFSKLSSALHGWSLILSIALPFYFFTTVVFEFAKLYIKPPLWPYTIVVVTLCVSWGLSLAHAYGHTTGKVLFIVAAAFLCSMSGGVGILLLGLPLLGTFAFRAVYFTVAGLTALTALALALLTLRRLMQHFKLGQIYSLDTVVRTVYFIMHFITALGYYMLIYNPKGTVQASWTNELG